MVRVDKPEAVGHPVPAARARLVELPESLSVRQLSEVLHIGPIDAIKQLMRNGIMANINQIIDYKTAAMVASSLGYEARLKRKPVRKSAAAKIEEMKAQGEELHLQPRPPVVTVMGHVDHGKTKLLDAIRQTNVVDTEAGGITQHIGAYQAEINGQQITFIDTPGHEAFTSMRARGAQVTDIAVLVVAADDGVMPQTLEAINHARAAGVPIVVALNKIDKPEANPDRVKKQLSDVGLVCEEWGGDTICVPTSAREKKGISDLLENILLVAEMQELKADPTLPAKGVVIEAKLDKTKGPLATVLIREGTLKPGDAIVVGTTWGKVKAMFNYAGKRLKKAEPATPVELLGLDSVPQAGDILTVAEDESKARALVEQRQLEKQAAQAVTLSNLFDQITAGKVKDLNIILKADVQGSLEPIRQSLDQLSTEEVRVRIIHSGTGNVTESDVLLASASKGLIIGFDVNAEPGARRLAQLQGVSINFYDIIYNIVDDVSKALKGMLTPVEVEVVEGRAEVRGVFGSIKKHQAAGVYVTEGKISRGAKVRVWRASKKIAESEPTSLRRFKEDVREVAAGFEAGVVLGDFDKFEVGDILEFFRIQKRG